MLVCDTCFDSMWISKMEGGTIEVHCGGEVSTVDSQRHYLACPVWFSIPKGFILVTEGKHY